MPEKEIQPPDTTIKLGSFSFFLHMTDLRLHNSALYEKNKNKKKTVKCGMSIDESEF